MDFNVKVYINRLGDKLIAKFTPEDMKIVYASGSTLRKLAKSAMPFNWGQCTLHHDGITWKAEPGDWDDMDIEEVENFLKEMMVIA